MISPKSGDSSPVRLRRSRAVGRHQLGDGDYRLGQLRYDLAKLRAKGLVERVGTSRRYRFTPQGLKLGVRLVKLRTRLLGPLTTLATQSTTSHAFTHRDAVNAAFHNVRAALDHLSATLGFKHAA
jgi:hypothetical protein